MRLIDAEKLCELARSHTTKSVDCNDIMRFPTANVQEAKHGKWAHIGGDEWCCSCCGFIRHTEGSWEKPDAKYCENCGAKMELCFRNGT